jgi:integrase
MKSSQLHTFARADFQIYDATDTTGHIVMRDAGGMPLPTWPDGHWCSELSAYLIRCVRRSFSRISRGGTPGTYAHQLSHIVRYCFNNKCDFINLTDAGFTLFVKGLMAEKVVKNGALERKRDDNSVISIGRRTLEFLSGVGYSQGRPQLVAEDGIIKGSLKEPSDHMKGQRRKEARRYWHHNSFPKSCARRIRRPISDEYVGQLRAAILKMGGSSFLRRRRYVMLRCLEKTGGRRIEIAQLKVSHVLAAVKMAKRGEKPFIQMATFKKRGGPAYRKIPLNSVELDLLVEFIKYQRAPVLARTKKSHDFVFINERTGKPLTANTVTSEIRDMRTCAGIRGKASPHLFRHKYITDLMKDFIAEFNIPDKATFLETAKKMGALKELVLEYTGHSSAESLEIYIDYAFMDIKEIEALEERVDIKNLAESSEVAVNELQRLKELLPPEEFAKLAMKMIEALNRDLSRGRTDKKK